MTLFCACTTDGYESTLFSKHITIVWPPFFYGKAIGLHFLMSLFSHVLCISTNKSTSRNDETRVNRKKIGQTIKTRVKIGEWSFETRTFYKWNQMHELICLSGPYWGKLKFESFFFSQFWVFGPRAPFLIFLIPGALARHYGELEQTKTTTTTSGTSPKV